MKMLISKQIAMTTNPRVLTPKLKPNDFPARTLAWIPIMFRMNSRTVRAPANAPIKAVHPNSNLIWMPKTTMDNTIASAAPSNPSFLLNNETIKSPNSRPYTKLKIVIFISSLCPVGGRNIKFLRLA